jgi:hypothetical protein
MPRRNQSVPPNGEAVARAFKHFGIDPNKPRARDKLLEAMARRFFKKSGLKKSGRPPGSKTWTHDRLLSCAFELVELSLDIDGMSASEAASRLKAQPGKRNYPGYESLRKRIPAAARALQQDVLRHTRMIKRLKRGLAVDRRETELALLFAVASPGFVETFFEKHRAKGYTADRIRNLARRLRQTVDNSVSQAPASVIHRVEQNMKRLVNLAGEIEPERLGK